MDYCLDTSVFTQAHRQYYAFDIAPPFWAALTRLADEGTIMSPRAVYEEIMGGNDELKAWAKDHETPMFVHPDSDVNAVYRDVAKFANERYVAQHWIRDFLSGADPWVIAHAKASSLTVVTMELAKSSEDIDRPTGKIKGPIKMPNMGGHFGVKVISTFEMLRVLGVKLK